MRFSPLHSLFTDSFYPRVCPRIPISIPEQRQTTNDFFISDMEFDVDAHNPNEREVSKVDDNRNLTAAQTLMLGATTSAIFLAYNITRMLPLLISLGGHVATFLRFLLETGLQTFRVVANLAILLHENVSPLQSTKRITANFYHKISNRLNTIWKNG